MSAESNAELLACAVRVPCSTSNLGAGFDCLGLAFDRYLDVAFLPGPHQLEVQRAGTLADIHIAAGDDTVARAFQAALRQQRRNEATGTLVMTSTIPIGRGLGSSGAATVAGLALAAAACDEQLDREAALTTAVRLEGHPDNAAPSLFGGLIAIVYAAHGAPYAMRLPLSESIAFVFAAPEATVSTERARATLPQHVAHTAATRNLGRVAALLHGLAHADPVAIGAGFTDELHVPYRLPLIPGANDVFNAAREAGAWAATISGSGSGLLAACERGTEGRVLDAMVTAFQRASASGFGFIVRPDTHGAQPRDVGTLMDALASA